MSYYQPCSICKLRPATDAHHLLSNTKWARKKYKDRIHHDKNIIYICRECHINKTIPKLSEAEFLKLTGGDNDSTND